MNSLYLGGDGGGGVDEETKNKTKHIGPRLYLTYLPDSSVVALSSH